MEFKHISVLKNECIEGLKIRPDGVYVDGTLGGAGHALEVCRRLGPDGRFIGIDQDMKNWESLRMSPLCGIIFRISRGLWRLWE